MTVVETLLSVFTPPDGTVGHAAALVAMTAEDSCLNEALIRFTGLSDRRRAAAGVNVAFLFLDGRQSERRRDVREPGRVPGLHEMRPRRPATDTLLHAKVALLAFADELTRTVTHLRLAVLTANFTDTSMRGQLELIWVLDHAIVEREAVDDRADLAAAARFIAWLSTECFYREEADVPAAERKLVHRLDELLHMARNLSKDRDAPRFFHSVEAPLLPQIEARMSTLLQGRRAPNILLCGSGFYGQPSTDGPYPTVLRQLAALPLLSANARCVAVVEPTQAGALKRWAQRGQLGPWTLAEGTDPLRRARVMHAKYILIGFHSRQVIGQAVLYLGSGNLTYSGLQTSGASGRGNIECGVVIPLDNSLNAAALRDRLFWDGEASVSVDAWEEGEVGDTMMETQFIEVAPVLSARLLDGPPRSLEMSWRPDLVTREDVEVRWNGGAWCAVDDTGMHTPVSETDEIATIDVRCTSNPSRQWCIPVVDPAGRVCWTPPQYTSLDDVLAELLAYPLRVAAGEGLDDLDDDGGSPADSSPQAVADDTRPAYALHDAAVLIEAIAEHQCLLAPEQLHGWIDHLEQLLAAHLPPGILSRWLAHGVNPLQHLLAKELSPVKFTPAQRASYEQVLRRAASAWGLST